VQIVEEIINFAESKGLFISKDVLGLLEKNSDWKKILEELIVEGNFIIDEKVLGKKISRTKMSNVIQEVEIRKTNFSPQAKDRSPDFKIMSEYDVSGQSNSEGKVDDFLRLFRSKFKLLSTMLKERHNLNPIEIKNLRTVPKNENVDIIGMVNKKWITKNNHQAFEIEDLETKCIVLIMQKENDLMLKGARILEDNVIGVK
jgi:DNA polymerase II small subunit/DNA polymerase delta subunit B